MWKAASTCACSILGVALVAAAFASTANAAPADWKTPTSPSRLGPTRVTATSLSVSWKASRDPGGGVAGYRVYLNDFRVAVTSQTSYTFTDLTCGKSYTVGVEAFDFAGNSSTRTSVVVSTSACADASPPTGPTGLTQTTATQTSIGLSWSASVDNVAVTAYETYRDGAVMGSTSSTTFTFGGLICGRSYILGVKAVDAAGNSSSLASVAASTSPCPDTLAPTVPGYLAVTATANDSISVSWTASLDNVGVEGYGVYVNGALRATTPLTTHAVLGLPCGTMFTLAVDAYDAAANRSAKVSVNAATGACSGTPPTTISTTFLPTADARVEQANPSANFGTSYLRVDGGGDPVTETDLSFSVAGLGGTVTRAVLRLYATTATVDGPTVHSGGTSWSETAVTWSTRPAYAADRIADSTTISAGRWVEYDVTPVVTKTGSYGFALETGSMDGVDFDSREGTMPPQLVVTTSGGSADTQPPTAPTGLASTGATIGSIALSWNASTDNASLAGYGVYVNGTKVASTAGTGYTVSGLSCATSYTVAVDAYDTSGNRSTKTSIPASTTACATSPPPPPPPPPPAPSLSGGWGGFANPANLPPANWRPYMDTAAWNIGTARATIHPDSAAMISYLRSVSGGKAQSMVVGSLGREYGDGAALHFADTDDPVYTVHCTQWTSSCEVEGAQVRIPAGAKPTPMTWDRHMTVVQPDGTEYSFWESDIPSGRGGTLNVSHGGRGRIDGDSTGIHGTAGVVSASAGEIRSTSWIAGTIPHAIALTVYRTKATSVYPVRTDDCKGHLAATDPASPVPNGQWFKLNITDAELALEPAWRRPIYRAMRDYGGFVIDTGGSGFGWSHANEMAYGSYGVQDPAFDWLARQPGVSLYDGRQVAATPSFPFDKLVALNPPPEARPCS